MLFAFISLVFLQQKVRLKSEVYKETIQSSYLAFDYLNQAEIPYGELVEFKFTEHKNEKTFITRKHWGAYDLGIVQSTIKNETSQKVALLGNKNSKREALYLQENNQSLVLVGNAKIVGDVILPKRGVKTGNIAGVSYYGDEFVYGTIRYNAGKLPVIHTIEYLKQFVQGVFFDDMKSFDIQEGMLLKQAFTDETLLFETPVNLDLQNLSLQGNLVVVSATKIRVHSSVNLQNVILMAPEVVVESGVKGSFQILATQKVLIKSKAELLYPSSIVLLDNSEQEKAAYEEARIQIQEQAQVRGSVVYNAQKKGNNYKTQVFVAKGAKITGEVYCNLNLDLRGKIDGFVYTNNFITKEAGGIYLNHIYNGQIDAKSISEHYSGLLIGNTMLKVARWIE